MKTTAINSTPPTAGSDKSASSRSAFVSLALDMTWKLAFVVLVPIIGGVYLDKAADTSPLFTVLGLVVAVFGSIAVMWQIVRTASKLPVPKLSAEEKRRIQKSYEEDDADA